MLKEKTVILRDGDKDLTVVVKQMSALKLERFINRAAILIARATGKAYGRDGINTIITALSGSDENSIFDRLVEILGGLDYEQVEPLYNELMECCYIIPDPANPSFRNACTPQLLEAQVESPMTLYKMRAEAVKVNFSFFTKGKDFPDIHKTSISFPKLTKTSRRSQGQ